ncbi:MAG TPA: hypothetical protein VFJ93_05325 [Gaiellaceae bacterium]|jgi:hypothetical protein|nr:hypothetical protein [Gaiellaceae bacterium]
MSDALLASYVVLWVLVVAQSLFLFVLLRELGRVYLRDSASLHRDGVPIGQQMPNVAIEGPTGAARLRTVLRGRPTIVVVASPSCSLCPPVIALAERWTRRVHGLGLLVLVNGETLDGYAHLADRVVRADSQDIATRLLVRATPFVLVLDDAAVVRAKGIVNSNRHMSVLVRQARLRSDAAPQRKLLGRLSAAGSPAS